MKNSIDQGENPLLAFGGRLLEDNKLEYSGLVCLAFDQSVCGDLANVRKVLNNDPHTVVSFTGKKAGGRFYALFQADTAVEDHKKAVRKAGVYIMEHYGICPTILGEDSKTVLAIEFDPHSYYNPNAKTFSVAEKPEYTPQSAEPTQNVDPLELLEGIRRYQVRKQRIDLLLDQIATTTPELHLSKVDRINFGMGLGKSFGQSGRALFHQLCHWAYGYDQAATDQEYDLCLKTKGHGKDEHSVFAFLEGVLVGLKSRGVVEAAPEVMAVEVDQVAAPQPVKRSNMGRLGRKRKKPVVPLELLAGAGRDRCCPAVDRLGRLSGFKYVGFPVGRYQIPDAPVFDSGFGCASGKESGFSPGKNVLISCAVTGAKLNGRKPLAKLAVGIAGRGPPLRFMVR